MFQYIRSDEVDYSDSDDDEEDIVRPPQRRRRRKNRKQQQRRPQLKEKQGSQCPGFCTNMLSCVFSGGRVLRRTPGASQDMCSGMLEVCCATRRHLSSLESSSGERRKKRRQQRLRRQRQRQLRRRRKNVRLTQYGLSNRH